MEDEKDGVWKTIRGRRVFIRNGESLSDAMKRSGKFSPSQNFNQTQKILQDMSDKWTKGSPRYKEFGEFMEDYNRFYDTLDPEEIKEVLIDYEKYCDMQEGYESNPIGEYLNKKLGYDAKPELISEKDFENSRDLDKIYRGIYGKSQNEVDSYIKAFKEGKYFAGSGCDGNGTYFSNKEFIANAFMDGDEDSPYGGLLKATLNKDAKVVELGDINSFQNVLKTTEYIEKYKSKGKDYSDFSYAILSDQGYTAALMGYDAIYNPLNGNMIILNRKSVKVVK